MLCPEELPPAEVLFMPVLMNKDNRFQRRFAAQLAQCGAEKQRRRVFLPYVDFNTEQHNEIVYYRANDSQDIVSAQDFAILESFSPAVSNKALGETVKELQKSFKAIVFLLQLPVAAKFAEGQFGTSECVRQVDGHLSTEKVKVLEQVEDMDKFTKMLRSAMAGERTARLLKSVGTAGIVVSFE